MSKKKQKPILSDQIAELIAPRRLLDPEIDSEDETAARAIEHEIGGDLDETEIVTELSDIRKKNVKLLQDIDAKYRGKVTSRKELDLELDSDDESDVVDESVEVEEDEEGDDEIEESAERSMGEFSIMLTPKQRIKLAQEAGGSEEENTIESGESSENEDDIKLFTKKLINSKATNIEEDNDSDADLAPNSKDELEKWDDDYEGEEMDEEESENDDEMGESDNDDNEDDFENEDGSDDESDYDGGDIMPKTSEEIPKKQDLSRILPKQQSDDHLSKGVCVQNQLQIWEKLLEVRIHSQKMLIKANSLPQSTKFEQLAAKSVEFTELAAQTEENVTNLVTQMRDLQSLLLNQYSETKTIASKRKPIKLDDLDDSEAKRKRIEQKLAVDFSDLKDYQMSVISKWHDRTKVLTPGSIKTQKQQGNIDILRKIEGVLANRADLIKKSQTLKGGYELFDENTGITDTKPSGTLSENENDAGDENQNDKDEVIYCDEIYDDTDFYHTQLRELIEYKTSSSSNANEMAKQFTELQKLRQKMKKTVDTRASKGRKIRYVVHNKLVSFMAPNDPIDWNDDQKNELYKSLFGAQS